MKKEETNIYILAHEIKNPLCVAQGYLEMLNKDNLDNYREIIKKEINTSLEILDNYMEYNKITINKEEIDLNLLLNDINDSMQDYLKQNNVQLKINFIDDDIYLKADYNKLKQVFYNIIKNSVEASAQNIYINYELLKSKIKIYIKNDGLLINNLDEIGENYSDKVLGHGIGTTLSKKIILMHEGTIHYANKDLVTCLITLPRK